MSVRRDDEDYPDERRRSRAEEDQANAEEACVECGLVDEWNFAVRHADGTVSWGCQEHGQDGLVGDEAV